MLILVDASGYIYRAFYALPPLTKADGTPTGAVLGFCRMLWQLKKDRADASHFGVVFDKGRCAHRTALYPPYKAQRPSLPDDLRLQLDPLRDAARAFGFQVIEAPNVEADDLIASYAAEAERRCDDVTIVSADKDMMQLIRPGVVMWDPLKQREITVDDVRAKLGVRPELAIDAQALIGDASDNVPGVPGVGAKTAGALLEQFGSLDALLANWQQVSRPKIRDALMLHAGTARQARDLVALRCDVALPLPMKALEARDVDAARLIAFANSMEFVSFAADVAAFYGASA